MKNRIIIPIDNDSQETVYYFGAFIYRTSVMKLFTSTISVAHARKQYIMWLQRQAGHTLLEYKTYATRGGTIDRLYSI